VLPLIVFGPLIVGFVLLFLPRRISFLSKALAVVVSTLALVTAIFILKARWYDYAFFGPHIRGLKLDLLLSAKPLGSFMLVFAMAFALLIALYSLKSMAGAKKVNTFYGALLMTVGGSAGILLSDNLIFLLIFWEIVTAALYLLIATGGKNSNFAATKSFAMIGASDAAFLLGILMVAGNIRHLRYFAHKSARHCSCYNHCLPAADDGGYHQGGRTAPAHLAAHQR
jgi:NADH:ubiquinone oxidoreductase subunit 5 (subunit L)/multisubunit Na+/H+ antiporter MnhA subunit